MRSYNHLDDNYVVADGEAWEIIVTVAVIERIICLMAARITKVVARMSLVESR